MNAKDPSQLVAGLSTAHDAVTHRIDFFLRLCYETLVGGAMKLGFAVVFLMIFAFGLFVAFPAEDFPETAYDESEAPTPFEAVPLFSIAVPRAAARTTQRVLSSLHLKPGALSLFVSARVHDTDAKSADARPSFTLLCTLLC